MSGRTVTGVLGRIVRYVVIAIFAIYFFLPLLAMLDFSTRAKGGQEGRTGAAWANLLTNDALRTSIITSLILAVVTVVLMLVLLVPTMIWVRLRVPKMSRPIEFLCLLPLTIPALVIVVGITNVYSWVDYILGPSTYTLAFAYVVLVLPYAYRSIDAALSSIDVTTLAEAARSLGAGWFTVITTIVVPNIVGGMLGAAFISVALVLGEYTFASLLRYDTLPVQIAFIGKVDASTSVAASLASIVFASILLLGLSFLQRNRHTTGKA